MAVLRWNAAAAVGSRWTQAFTLLGSGTPLDLTGLTWEFVIRPEAADTTVPALVQVTTTPSAQGQITVDLTTATVTVTLAPAATTALGRSSDSHALWSNPGTTTATCWVAGVFSTSIVAKP